MTFLSLHRLLSVLYSSSKLAVPEAQTKLTILTWPIFLLPTKISFVNLISRLCQFMAIGEMLTCPELVEGSNMTQTLICSSIEVSMDQKYEKYERYEKYEKYIALSYPNKTRMSIRTSDKFANLGCSLYTL